MTRIHWCGTGLSTAPGIRRLIQAGRPMTLWNRTKSKAEAVTEGLTGDFAIEAFSHDALANAVDKGDVVVSMLPGDFHVGLADLALANDAHFVSSSYIAPEMRERDALAKQKGLSVVNEVGLDPGIDHLMAHALVADYKASTAFDPSNAHFFRSYCGGFPKVANDFRYKFSWSPLGVLKALKSPSRSIRDGKVFDVSKPWDALTSYTAHLPDGEESFEVYPNRDSLPYRDEYGFDDAWNVQQFVRGTLRINGWADAWSDIFEKAETLTGDAATNWLTNLSAELWEKYAYDEGEPDRVVLSVDLQAQKDGKDAWHKSYVLDSTGNKSGTAMARLVSIPLAMAIEAVIDGRIPPGVSGAPDDPQLIGQWLGTLQDMGEPLQVVDHLG